MGLTQQEARDLLISLLPPGATDLYEAENSAAGPYRYFDGLAQALRLHGTDQVDNLRLEAFPSTATEKIEDWEAALRLLATAAATSTSDEARRNQIIARLREHGASTLPNIKAAAAAIMGYTPDVIEVPRADLDALIGVAPEHFTVPPLNYFETTITVTDAPLVSQAGARLQLKITIAADAELLSVTLSNPGGIVVKQWPAGCLEAGAVDRVVYLYGIEFAGAAITGDWALRVTNAGAVETADVAAADSFLLVDAIGRNAGPGNEGYGAAIFEWAIRVDSALLASTANIDEILAIAKRWNPAHCNPFVVLKNAAGGNAGVWGDPTLSLWNRFTWE